MTRQLQNSENSGILRDFLIRPKKCKNGKRLSVTFLHFFGLIKKDPKDRLFRVLQLPLKPLQFCKQWLWIVVLAIVSFALYEQACRQIEKDITSLQKQIDEIEIALTKEMQLQQDLVRAVASQNDPAWIELCLIRGLGVVPQGYTKVVVKNR